MGWKMNLQTHKYQEERKIHKNIFNHWMDNCSWVLQGFFVMKNVFCNHIFKYIEIIVHKLSKSPLLWKICLVITSFNILFIIMKKMFCNHIFKYIEIIVHQLSKSPLLWKIWFIITSLNILFFVMKKCFVITSLNILR